MNHARVAEMHRMRYGFGDDPSLPDPSGGTGDPGQIKTGVPVVVGLGPPDPTGGTGGTGGGQTTSDPNPPAAAPPVTQPPVPVAYTPPTPGSTTTPGTTTPGTTGWSTGAKVAAGVGVVVVVGLGAWGVSTMMRKGRRRR
jgi:hypothetical protein